MGARSRGARGTLLAALGWALLGLEATAQGAGGAGTDATEDTAARDVVARALDLMGGLERLGSVRTVRFDMMTQWQRTGFRTVPWTDRPSFEPHVDVRDYALPAWRNTRDFGARKVVNVVRDSVAITSFGGSPQPLSVAYVDERDELFTYTPDRLVLRLAGAEDLRAVGDTVIGSEAFTTVAATLGGFTNGGPVSVRVAFHEGTGLPALLRFRRAHANDFGLVPLGDMRVEVWYSNWRTFGSVSIPTQWDVLRAGAPYKRMTVRAATFDPDLAGDSFPVDASQRAAYLASVAPMHDRPVDSVRVIAPGVVAVHGFGFPTGAVQSGAGWILFEAGQTPLNLQRARERLADVGVGDIAAAVVASARVANGAVTALVEERVPVYTSRAASPFLGVMLGTGDRAPAGVTVVGAETRIGEGDEHLLVHAVDLPDTPGSLVAYSPRHRWLYAPDVVTGLDRRMVLDHARAVGWRVDALGTGRTLWTELDVASDGAR